MPSPTTNVPKTHSVTVNLNQVFLNIQRATTYVYEAGGTPQRQPEFPSSPQESDCHIETMEALQEFLQPALAAGPSQLTKKWFSGQSIHLLAYSDAKKRRQHIVMTPTDIFSSERDQQCSITQGLAYYLGVALEITPPSSAQDMKDAAMIGYIRCFGAGNLDCPHYQEFAPQTPPSYMASFLKKSPQPLQEPDIYKLLNFQHLATVTQDTRLKHLYITRVTQHALNLATVVLRDTKNDDSSAKEVERLIANFTPRFKTDYNKPLDNETSRLMETSQHFLSSLFATAAWQVQYDQFRTSFLCMECKETKGSTPEERQVSCSKYGYHFNIRTKTHTQVSKTN